MKLRYPLHVLVAEDGALTVYDAGDGVEPDELAGPDRLAALDMIAGLALAEVHGSSRSDG